MPLDKFPLVITNFQGKNTADTNQINTRYKQSNVPFDYALENINLESQKQGDLITRRAINNYIDRLNFNGAPIQFWKITNLLGTIQTDRWLILSEEGGIGYIYDTGIIAPATNPILSLVGMKYAFVLNSFGKIYITPWSDWAEPLANASVYVYTGAYNARLTKASAPVVGTYFVAAAAGGFVTPGLHYVSVLFETDTGYISICPTTHLLTPLSVTTTTANATINGTNVPVGPAGSGVIKRHIIITKVVVNPTNQGLKGYEPFIALTINDNITTTFSFANPDSALVDSASIYIEDKILIPSCVSLASYGSRLVYIGPKPTIIEDSILISPPNRPEQVITTYTLTAGGSNTINDISTKYIGADFSGKPMIAAELNKVLYIFKEDSTFSVTADDTLDPSEWEEPAIVEGGKGAFPFGIAKVSDNPSVQYNNYLIVAGNHGITPFNGTYSDQSIADYIWDEYFVNDLKWIKIVNDPVRKQLFMHIGDPAADTITALDVINNLPTPINNNIVIIANYYYGINNTKWSIFKYSLNSPPRVNSITIKDIVLREPNTPGDIGPTTIFDTVYPLLTILTNEETAIGIFSAHIYSESTKLQDFDSIPIVWSRETGYTPNKQGEKYTFGPLMFLLQTNNPISIYKGFLGSRVYDLITTFDTLVSSVATLKYVSINMNAVAERIRLKISGTDMVLLKEMILFATENSKERPRV